MGGLMSETCLSVDLKKVKSNIKYLSNGKKVCIVVKANAYGMGYDIIKEYYDLGYDFFAVTVFEEALEIRNRIKDCQILILTEVEQENLAMCADNNFTLSVSNLEYLKAIPLEIKIHLKFDVSMGRIGFLEHQHEELSQYLESTKVKLDGIFTHFACAIDDEITIPQIENFRNIVSKFQGFNPKYIHCQNTVAAIKYNVDFCNMIRPGIGILGFYADHNEAKILGNILQPAVKLTAKVLQVKEHNGPISYDYTQTVKDRVTTIRIGYYDGIDRKLQGFKSAGYEIVGRICMCQMIVINHSNTNNIEIFGDNTSLYDIAKYLDKIVYEILVSLSNRIKREYI